MQLMHTQSIFALMFFLGLVLLIAALYRLAQCSVYELRYNAKTIKYWVLFLIVVMLTGSIGLYII